MRLNLLKVTMLPHLGCKFNCFYVTLHDQIPSAVAPLLQLNALAKVKPELPVGSAAYIPLGCLCVFDF